MPYWSSSLAVALGLSLGIPGGVDAREPIDFNRDIRPILSENCYYCHGQDANKREADLRLDVREVAIAAGAIAPGEPRDSSLVERILATDPDQRMPPPKSNRHLSQQQKELLQRWIASGAEYQPHWAFVAPQRPTVPEVQQAAWVRNDVDRFILAQLESAGLRPTAEADRPTLIRRLHADLVGLPPTPEEVDAFVADTDPGAYEKLVDRLLASPHYGERMALSWLDAARYADSNGFQQDGDTFQWIWRDWVVKALNADMPFDRFSIEQLAGDLLPDATITQKIASAFNRNHLINGEGGAIPEEQRWVILFDRVDTTATTWLGLTMACAQCHDHKYDPLTQRDYYSLLDAFNRVSETGDIPQQISPEFRLAPPFIEVQSAEDQARIALLEEEIASTEKAGKPSAVVEGLRKQLARYKKSPPPRLMVMDDKRPRETKILDRGDYLAPKGEKLSFAPPASLPPLPSGEPANRLGLARWLFAPDHPLTARVQVNRMWQHFFGAGIVKTTEDLGIQSEYPVHRPLLDWLATEFVRRGWSQKQMHRLLVSSATYRQSGKISAELLVRDPENRFFARASRFRMPSAVLRDWALGASGLLDRHIGGRPVYPYQPQGIWESLAITNERDFTYPASHGADLYRRSLYTFWRRTVGPANMFDAASRQTCRVRTSITCTPLHALTTLNDPTWVEAARVLAKRSMQSAADEPARLTFAFRRILGRTPRETDLQALSAMYQRQLAVYRDDVKAAEQLVSVGESNRNEKLDIAEQAALSAVCLAILNLDEALTRE